MTIILRGGPLDGQTDTNIRDECAFYRRSTMGPSARYKTTNTDDANGYRIFQHWPPLKLGEAGPTEGVHDA